MNSSIVKDPVTSSWKVVRGSPLEFHVISLVHSSWGSQNNGYFPGPQPVSIERSHFQILKRMTTLCAKRLTVFVIFLSRHSSETRRSL